MNKYYKIALVLGLLVLGLFLPDLNGGFCIFSVDDNVALGNVTRRFHDGLSPNTDASNGVSCSVSDVERPELVLHIFPKWQATCTTNNTKEWDHSKSESSFYYIMRCGGVSYSYSFE